MDNKIVPTQLESHKNIYYPIITEEYNWTEAFYRNLIQIQNNKMRNNEQILD